MRDLPNIESTVDFLNLIILKDIAVVPRGMGQNCSFNSIVEACTGGLSVINFSRNRVVRKNCRRRGYSGMALLQELARLRESVLIGEMRSVEDSTYVRKIPSRRLLLREVEPPVGSPPLSVFGGVRRRSSGIGLGRLSVPCSLSLSLFSVAPLHGSLIIR